MSSTDTTTNPIIKLGRVLKPSNSDSEDRPELARSSTHEKEARHAAEKQREQARQEAKKEMIEHEKHEIQRRRQIADEKAQLEEDPETRASYGDINELEEITPFEDVIGMPAGTKVNIRGRIHQQRDLSSHLNFILLRQRGFVIQGVLSEHASEHMIKWVQHLPGEAIVQVFGTLREPPKPITAAVDTPLELDIERLYLMETSHDIPFNLAHGDRPPQSTRLRNRTLDLRHPTTQAIFKIRAKVLKVFRDTLDDLGFLEINTPKLQPSATESGAEVFRVNYFGRKAFLAQSPQLMKQMAISADFRRVYEACFSIFDHNTMLTLILDRTCFPCREQQHSPTPYRVHRSGY